MKSSEKSVRFVHVRTPVPQDPRRKSMAIMYLETEKDYLQSSGTVSALVGDLVQ